MGVGVSGILTSRRNDIESKLVSRECGGKLPRHMRHSGLTSRVGIMRHGDAAVRADRAGDDRLAALSYIALLVSRSQEWQEGCNAEVHGTNIDTEGLVERRRVNVPQRLLIIYEGCGGGGLSDWACDACIRDEEVDEACLFGDMRDDALQVRLGARIALQWDDVAVLLSLASVFIRCSCPRNLVQRTASSLATLSSTSLRRPMM